MKDVMRLLGAIGSLLLFIVAFAYGWRGEYAAAAYYMAFSVSVRLSQQGIPE